MASTKFTWFMALLAGLLVPLCTGCIPVTPFKHKSFEDKHYVQERYARVPILGPITAGGPVKALDPPTEDEIWWALERARPVQGGMPFFHEIQRNNVKIFPPQCIADYIDPPRIIPMIGPAQLHHAHYKCKIMMSETKWVGWPYQHMLKDEDVVEVVYLDHNHFHMVGPVSSDLDCDCN